MEIKTIAYKRIKNLGNYENKTLEVTANLTEGEDFNVAAANLQQLVDNNLGIEQEIEDLKRVRAELEDRLYLLNNHWTTVKDFLNPFLPKEKIEELKSVIDNIVF